jgi:hypothetical protein
MIWKVNGEETNLERYMDLQREILPEIQMEMAGKPSGLIEIELKKRVKDRICVEQMLKQEAVRREIPIDEEEFDKSFKEFLKRKDVKETLKEVGKARDKVKKEMRQALHANEQYLRFIEGLGKDFEPSDNEIKEAYDLADFTPEEGEDQKKPPLQEVRDEIVAMLQEAQGDLEFEKLVSQLAAKAEIVEVNLESFDD